MLLNSSPTNFVLSDKQNCDRFIYLNVGFLYHNRLNKPIGMKYRGFEAGIPLSVDRFVSGITTTSLHTY